MHYSVAEGIPMIMRTCTNELDFKLPLVNNVCQQESDGFGYLCMCGRGLCNKASSLSSTTSCLLMAVVVLLLTVYPAKVGS